MPSSAEILKATKDVNTKVDAMHLTAWSAESRKGALIVQILKEVKDS